MARALLLTSLYCWQPVQLVVIVRIAKSGVICSFASRMHQLPSNTAGVTRAISQHLYKGSIQVGHQSCDDVLQEDMTQHDMR